MQYKQLLLCAAVSLSAISSSHAQYAHEGREQRFYIKVGAQYAMPIMGNVGFKGHAEPSLSGRNLDTFNEKSSFGEGLWVAASVGYFITPNIGIEGGILVGITQPEATLKRDDYYIHDSVSTRAKRSILLNPSIVYRVPFNKLSIVGRTGVVIPLNITLKQSKGYYYDAPPATTPISGGAEFEIRNKLGLGFSCSLGAEYRFTNYLALSLDLNVVALTVNTKEKELTSYKLNGEDVMDQVSPQNRITHYANDAVVDPNGTTYYTPMPISFSNASARLGFIVYF